MNVNTAASLISTDILGQFFSLMAALTWAVALILFKQCGDRLTPIALNLYKSVVGLLLLGTTLAMGVLAQPGELDGVLAVPPRTWLILLASGAIGIALADTLFFHALNIIGVGLISIADCAYAPTVVLLSWLLLAERLGWPHYLGGALVLLGVYIASQHQPPGDRTRGQIARGMALAVVAVALMAYGIVLAKPLLGEVPLLWATTLRMAGGTLVLVAFGLVGGGWQKHWAVFRPAAVWRYALPASILGTYICMIFWVAGFKYTQASIAAVLNQTSVIFASILAALILKEQFGPRKVAAAVLAMAGVALVALAPQLQRSYGP